MNKSGKKLLQSIIIITMLVTAIANVKADDDRESGDHKCKGIVTACDLKAYSNSPVNSKAYAFFQGYVQSAMSAAELQNSTCPFNVDLATVIVDVKKSLQSLADCKTISAQDQVNSVLAKEPRICF